MTDLERAKALLADDPTLTCVFCRNGETLTSQKRGIAPPMDFLDADRDLRGFSVADRIVGRAAALLFVLAGVKEVHAEVLGEGALGVLNESGIPVTYGTLTPCVINRRGDGPCPMERAVEAIDDPALAREAIRQTLQRLKEKGAN